MRAVACYFKFLFFLICVVFSGHAIAKSHVQRDGVDGLHPYRILDFSISGVSLEYGYEIVDAARNNNLNAIQFLLTDGVKLSNSLWSARNDAWSKDELLAWASCARSRGLNVIPEVKLLTHQENYLKIISLACSSTRSLTILEMKMFIS